MKTGHSIRIQDKDLATLRPTNVNEGVIKRKIKVPDCGDIVHFYPIAPAGIATQFKNHFTKYPAIAQDYDMYATLHVMQPFSNNEPVRIERTVPHFSEFGDGTGFPGYWKWPNEK